MIIRNIMHSLSYDCKSPPPPPPATTATATTREIGVKVNTLRPLRLQLICLPILVVMQTGGFWSGLCLWCAIAIVMESIAKSHHLELLWRCDVAGGPKAPAHRPTRADDVYHYTKTRISSIEMR